MWRWVVLGLIWFQYHFVSGRGKYISFSLGALPVTGVTGYWSCIEFYPYAIECVSLAPKDSKKEEERLFLKSNV
jgi:hypothetical protein